MSQSKSTSVSRYVVITDLHDGHRKSVNTGSLINTCLRILSNINTVSLITYLFHYPSGTKVINKPTVCKVDCIPGKPL